jgi:sugar phosphate isomerase/epimerase
MRELAVAIHNSNKNVDVIATIKSVKQAGFKNVFVQWYDEDWKISQEEQVKLCKEFGLNIIFAHLGYQNINDIWGKEKKGDKLVDRYKEDIKNCSENNINLVIMHLTSKKQAPMYNEIGLNRIRKIVEYAKEKNVKIAFENTKIKGYLEYVIENIKDENVGICYDSGHCHCHFEDEFNYEFFKNRIFAVHLHDNDKTDDLHLVPFDGTINWDNVVEKLKDANYNGPITLELCYRYDYLKMSLDDFYKKAYETAEKIADMFEK